MARIRSVKPEFFTHPEIVRLTLPARLLLLSLLTQADDEGRMYDQPTRIRGEAFGEDDKVVIGKLLDELAEHDRIYRYEAEGRRCLQVQNFSVHQKVSHPTPSRIPPDPLANGSGNSPERLRPSRARADLEQGTGNREQGSKALGSDPPEESGFTGVSESEPDAFDESTIQDLDELVDHRFGEVLDAEHHPDDYHLWLKVCRRDRLFADVWPGIFPEIRETHGDAVLTETLRRLVDRDLAAVRHRRAFVMTLVHEVANGGRPEQASDEAEKEASE